MYESYKNQNEPRVNLIYSVFFEMACSLHVLSNDAHHNARRAWSKQMKEKMSQEELDKITYFCSMTNNWLNLLDFINEEKCWNKSVNELLDLMKRMKDLEFYAKLFTDIYSKETVERGLLSLNIAPEIAQEHKYIFENSIEERSKLLKFLEDYYNKYFAFEISLIEQMYIRKIEHQHKLLKDTDVYEFVQSLHPRIENTKEKLNFHKYKLFEIYKKDLKTILIFVTSFGMPHLLLGAFSGGISLSLPLYLTEFDENEVPKDTVNILKSLADPTRLQIIRQLYTSPNSTQSLADKLNLTEAAISKNLKILYKAKVVSKERDGNYVNYHLNIKMIDKLTYLLYEVISQ